MDLIVRMFLINRRGKINEIWNSNIKKVVEIMVDCINGDWIYDFDGSVWYVWDCIWYDEWVCFYVLYYSFCWDVFYSSKL